jgi:hypothetical protein
MTPSDIIRAWKDLYYRAGLSATQQAQLPEPTLQAAQPTYGFRQTVAHGLKLRTGVKAGQKHIGNVKYNDY